MRYQKMAKHWLYEWGVNAPITERSGTWLEAHKEFTPGEFRKFEAAVVVERDRYYQRMVDEGVLA